MDKELGIVLFIFAVLAILSAAVIFKQNDETPKCVKWELKEKE